MLRRLGLSAVVLLGMASPALAGYRPFTFTYDTYPMAKGELEFEQWFTYSGPKVDGESFNRFAFREEIEYGLTDNFRLAFYVPSWSYEKSKERSDVDFDNAGIEGILLLSNPTTDFLGVGLYGEVKFGEHELELEQKLLLHKDVGPWTFAYNLVVETELEGIFGAHEETEVEGVLGHTFGIAYSLSPSWRVGAEAIVESKFEDWSHYEGTTVYAGPVLSYQGSHVPGTDWTWWATVTPTVQLTNHHDEPDFQIRMILGIEF